MDGNMQGEAGLGYGHVGPEARNRAPWTDNAAPGIRGQLSSNPKDAIGRTKTPLHLIPGPALLEMAKVMGLGAQKYGAYNWRDASVASTVYISAAQRHLLAFLDGEDRDHESGASHLAHAAACCAILLDAYASGNLVEDRPTPAYGTPRGALNGAPTPPFCEAVKADKAQRAFGPLSVKETQDLLAQIPQGGIVQVTPAPTPATPRPFLWYLATPYSASPDGMDVAHGRAVLALGELLKRGVKVFCPITHGHHAGSMLPRDHDFWMDVDRPFMDRCDGLLVLQQPGWASSRGIAEEIATFRRAGKPVVHSLAPNMTGWGAPLPGFSWDDLVASLAAAVRGEG